MQWSDVVKPPSHRMLREFAALCLIVFGGLAAWCTVRGNADAWTWALGVSGGAVGILGLVRPAAIRWIYAGSMVAAFPLGWTISRMILLALFFLVFTPVALVFRLIGRDALRLRAPAEGSLWIPKRVGDKSTDYFHQF
jgi:hypothetical protein